MVHGLHHGFCDPSNSTGSLLEMWLTYSNIFVCLQDVMRVLVESGADVRAEDEQGFSALLNAVKVRSVGYHSCRILLILCKSAGQLEKTHLQIVKPSSPCENLFESLLVDKTLNACYTYGLR